MRGALAMSLRVLGGLAGALADRLDGPRRLDGPPAGSRDEFEPCDEPTLDGGWRWEFRERRPSCAGLDPDEAELECW